MFPCPLILERTLLFGQRNESGQADSKMVPADEFDRWVTNRTSSSDAQLRLFCFPYAAGGASIFSSWPSQLPSEVDVIPLQLPGRENNWNHDPFTEMLPLVQILVQVLQPYLDMPYALLGHSMGGLISFELARELCKQNEPAPVHMFVSGMRAPQLPDPDPPMSELPESEFLAELSRRYTTVDQFPQDAELMKMILPLLRADIALCESYVYASGPPLDFPISVFGGLADPKANREELSAWRAQTCSSFSLRMFPGEHFFLQSAQMSFLRVLSRLVA